MAARSGEEVAPHPAELGGPLPAERQPEAPRGPLVEATVLALHRGSREGAGGRFTEAGHAVEVASDGALPRPLPETGVVGAVVLAVPPVRPPPRRAVGVVLQPLLVREVGVGARPLARAAPL